MSHFINSIHVFVYVWREPTHSADSFYRFFSPKISMDASETSWLTYFGYVFLHDDNNETK